jgi:hypothetical protein
MSGVPPVGASGSCRGSVCASITDTLAFSVQHTVLNTMVYCAPGVTCHVFSCSLPRACLCCWCYRFAGGCFGAIIVKDGRIVGEGYNNVVSRNDPTW